MEIIIAIVKLYIIEITNMYFRKDLQNMKQMLWLRNGELYTTRIPPQKR